MQRPHLAMMMFNHQLNYAHFELKNCFISFSKNGLMCLNVCELNVSFHI